MIPKFHRDITKYFIGRTKHWIFPGADPGIFVRGVQPSEKFCKAKKKKKKKRQKGEREGGFSIYSALVWLKSIFAINQSINQSLFPPNGDNRHI